MSDFPWDTSCRPGDEEWERRLMWAMGQPITGWWWLSFVDTDRPEGDRFLGVSIVPAGNVIQALAVAHVLRCNPGGQVAAHPLVDGAGHPATPKLPYRCRLFAGADGRRLAEMEPSELTEASDATR